MFRPVPAHFNGSLAPDAVLPFALPQLIENIFAALAIAMAAGFCLAGWATGWAGMLAIASSVVIVVAVPGLWLAEQASEAPRTFAASCWSLIWSDIETDADPSAFRSPPEGGAQALASVVAGGFHQLRRLQARYKGLRDAAGTASRTLRAGRREALQVETLLRSDGASIAEAASSVMAASANLAETTAAATDRAEATREQLQAATECALGLASATRATTAEIIAMANAAVSASERAFGAQRNVAALDAKCAALACTAEQVGQALRAAGSIGDASGSPDMEGRLRAMAEAADHALFAMQITAAELRVETDRAVTRLGELGELIHKQHQLGQALGHAVEQQSQEIAGMIEHLSGAHAGMDELRAGVEAITRSGDARLANAEALRGAACRLPAHADAIAGILRNLPDFAPPVGF